MAELGDYKKCDAQYCWGGDEKLTVLFDFAEMFSPPKGEETSEESTCLGARKAGLWELVLWSGDPMAALLASLLPSPSDQLPSSVTTLGFSFFKEEIKIPRVLCPAHSHRWAVAERGVP